MIEQKGVTFDHDFGYSFPLFSSLLKKEERIKGELRASKNRDQKSCLSARSHPNRVWKAAFKQNRIAGAYPLYISNSIITNVSSAKSHKKPLGL